VKNFNWNYSTLFDARIKGHWITKHAAVALIWEDQFTNNAFRRKAVLPVLNQKDHRKNHE
jgi:hypothetical protein